MIKMRAKFGSCAFCHVQFDIQNQEEILYDNIVRRAFHLGCPNVIIEQEQPVQEKAFIQPNEMLAQKQVAFRQSLQHVKTKTNTAEAYIVPELAKLYDGKFSIPIGQTNEHVTVHIYTQKEHSNFPGSRTVRVHYGRHNHKEFVKCGFITTQGQFRFYKEWRNSELDQQQRKIALAAVKLVLEGETNAEFALTYAKISKNCWRCGKDLYDPHTIDHLEETFGLGPSCFLQMKENHPEILQQCETSINDIRPKIVL